MLRLDQFMYSESGKPPVRTGRGPETTQRFRQFIQAGDQTANWCEITFVDVNGEMIYAVRFSWQEQARKPSLAAEVRSNCFPPRALERVATINPQTGKLVNEESDAPLDYIAAYIVQPNPMADLWLKFKTTKEAGNLEMVLCADRKRYPSLGLKRLTMEF